MVPSPQQPTPDWEWQGKRLILDAGLREQRGNCNSDGYTKRIGLVTTGIVVALQNPNPGPKPPRQLICIDCPMMLEGLKLIGEGLIVCLMQEPAKPCQAAHASPQLDVFPSSNLRSMSRGLLNT